MRIFVFILLPLAHLGVGKSAISSLTERKLHANKGTIEDGIKYLRGHTPPEATLCHQPGGGCCARLSCEVGAAIYACNDDESSDKVGQPL